MHGKELPNFLILWASLMLQEAAAVAHAAAHKRPLVPKFGPGHHEELAAVATGKSPALQIADFPLLPWCVRHR